ncbi:hypothetical protein J4477_01795 [Candidatus Pacearchaeota archaeon]|nr:hypothetical protein [Candidatus Pacearchaeota archaeon]
MNYLPTIEEEGRMYEESEKAQKYMPLTEIVLDLNPLLRTFSEVESNGN